MKYLYNKYLNICIIITSKWYLTEGHLKGEYLERNQFVEVEVLEEEVLEEVLEEDKITQHYIFLLHDPQYFPSFE